jgi:putative transposase
MSAGKKTPEPTTKRTASILIATMATVLTDLAHTNKTSSQCGQIGSRIKRRVVCDACGRRAHSDVKAAARNARPGERSLSPSAVQDRPDAEETGNHVGL